MNHHVIRINAAGLIDADQHAVAPAAIHLRNHTILFAGAPEQLDDQLHARTLPAPSRTIDCPDELLLPALINVHAHLDLSHIGPQPFAGSFADWATMIRTTRAVHADDITRAVHHGADLALRGGTALIGDIAGAASLDAARALLTSPIAGVSFLEIFGIGARDTGVEDRLRQLTRDAPDDTDRHRIGIQPHAPYSCSLATYQRCADLGRPLSTHLAETLEELEFIRAARGPLIDMLRAIGVWSPAITPHNCTPIAHLEPVLARTPCIAAHLNYITDDDLHRLTDMPITVAYCPRASAYFRHPRAGHAAHRYRDMIDAGINVALGTDSIVCLDTPDRLSILDDMRLLAQRDHTPGRDLLRMATINGARALTVHPDACTFAPGPTL
ncbi:MAG: amidohydrolase family protein, partial [Phycisphaerales bacterium]|nr:amidohydrolase family protein [Phycisphaerales bacterium]